MFLDFSGAFDEINRQAILRVAEMYPFLRGVVHEVVHHYMSFKQYVILPWAYQSRIVKWRVSFKGGV